jgi:pyrroloquinoline-quinone synthase
MTENNTEISARCRQAVEKYNLLSHSFYRRWTMGTLPVEALRDYAREYGAFISRISRGWESVGRPDIARTEEGHAKVWELTFANNLDTNVTVDTSTVEELVATSDELFADRKTAIGALFAIEAQQPVVAGEKIRGLEQHYAELPAACGDYFRIHLEDYDELAVLKEKMDELTPKEQEIALAASSRMAKALFDALTVIEKPYLDAAVC